MKIRVYSYTLTDASNREWLNVEPVEDQHKQLVADAVLKLIENDLKGDRTDFVEGLDQTFIDFNVNGSELTLELSPWYFISLRSADKKLLTILQGKIETEFEVLPRPQEDDE